MPGKSPEFANIEEELVALFARLNGELPPGVSSLNVNHTSSMGVVLRLIPSNPKAAEVWVHAENGFGRVDIGFGDYSPTWELPIEGENPGANKQELLEELAAMCKAVIAGNCQHHRGFLSVSGSIQVDGRPYKVTHLPELRTKPPLHGTRKYDPYVSPVAR